MPNEAPLEKSRRGQHPDIDLTWRCLVCRWFPASNILCHRLERSQEFHSPFREVVSNADGGRRFNGAFNESGVFEFAEPDGEHPPGEPLDPALDLGVALCTHPESKEDSAGPAFADDLHHGRETLAFLVVDAQRLALPRFFDACHALKVSGLPMVCQARCTRRCWMYG